MLIEVAQAKVENPNISQQELDDMHHNYNNVDEMKCFCDDYTVNGFYFWKFFTIQW
jgi:hypothetical protein